MNYEVIVSTKDNNFNFYQVFLNTLDSKQLLSFLHLNKISATISEKSLSILLAKASFAFLLISMVSYWFQMSFKSQILMGIDWETIKTLIFSKRIHDSKKKAINFNKTDKKEKIYSFVSYTPLVSMWFANITLAFLLVIRWIESGHFPLSNLYESLLFLSWGLTIIHLFLENLFYKREHLLCSLPYRSASASTLTLGAITSPVALFTNAFATFSLPQEMQKVTVLVPALKSNWLIMHVSVMIISYAALLSGSLLAMAFLVIKFIDDNKVPSYKFILTTFINSVSSLTQLIDKGLRGKKIYHAASYSSSSISAVSDPLLSNSEKYKFSATDPVGVKLRKPVRVKIGERQRGMVYLLPEQEENNFLPEHEDYNLLPEQEEKNFLPEQKDYNLLPKQEENNLEKDLLGEESKPLLLKNFTKENKVLMDLPEILDNLSYRSIGLGFALLTMGILSGAVWANEAWGSYWNWDPKETWALITWLVFALYLHTRLSKGWVGKKSAFVASFGFIVIWFCYLGVNLFGKGLHSYGWFQQ